MKPNPTLSARRTSLLKTIAAVVVTAVAALGLPAHAGALEPEPSASPSSTATPAADQGPAAGSATGPEATPTLTPVETATQAATDPAPGAIDMDALNAAIGANGGHMGQGLKTRLAASPRSEGTVIPEALQTENTWQAPGVQGLDVSSHQPTVNWPQQYSMGARFAYVKASEGVS